jgi:ATP-dependent protease Clp ATPase subunit
LEDLLTLIVKEVEMKGLEERNLTPRQIVEELDKYIIGQENAKKMLPLQCEIDGGA